MTKNWYVLQVYSNFEDKIADTIKKNADKDGVSEYIEDVFIPIEVIKVLKQGKLVTQEKKIHQGYVYLKLELNDKVYNFLKKIPKVSGFLTSGKGKSVSKAQPVIINQEEIDRIKNNDVKSSANDMEGSSYTVGEKVQVIDGPFQSFFGYIQGIDTVAAKLIVSVSIFNRETPVELSYFQVKKSSD